MPEPSFPWDEPQATKSNTKDVVTQIRGTVSATTGANTKVDSYKPDKRYGTGKPYRIEVRGDITDDSRKRGE
ncbi:MAG: hypothetical protein ABRQ23_06175 [Syntrophomonadaceae bacterium]